MRFEWPLQVEDRLPDGWVRYEWFVSYPITILRHVQLGNTATFSGRIHQPMERSSR